MARNSGLASDHHPVGPGDAPRRSKKSRKSTPSADVSLGNKRAASPTNEPMSPAPKRKRMQSDDHDQLERELQESVIRNQTHKHENVTKITYARRMSEPVVAFADNEDEEYDEDDDTQRTPSASTQPLPGLTPHLRRIGAPRGRPTNAAARRRARMSMPASFHVTSVDEANGSQIQFAPFKATIDSRTRRRLKRNHYSDEWNDLEDHKKEDRKLRKSYIELKRQLDEKNTQIANLEYQIEARRLGEIDLTDDETDDLREQLSQAKQQIEELRASSVYRGDSHETSAFDGAMDYDDDDYDDEPLLAIDPNDPDGPEMEDIEPLPNGEFATRVMQLSSQVTVDTLQTLPQTSQDTLIGLPSVPEKLSDKAVKRYETEIERLIELLGEAQGALRLVTIDLQNADILEPGATADAIISELRHICEDVREEMENLIPGCSEGLNNGQFLRKLPTLFEGLLSELQEKTIVAEKYHQEARLMRAQFENTLDLLERSETRNENLDAKIADLQRDNGDMHANIVDLEERVTTLDSLANQQDADLKVKDVKIHGLEDEVGDKEVALTRLRDSLEKYRTDLDSVTETATRTEEQLRQTIAELQQSHAADVLELQSQVQDENEARLQAQGEAEQKSEFIDELEERINGLENEIVTMTQDIEKMRDLLADESQELTTTKGALAEEHERVYAQQNEIENLEEKLEQLENELADAKANLETERAQREQTEALLDQANLKIEDLQGRLHEAGMESQGLRSKLFQAQMEREEQVKKLETDAQDRERELQNSLEGETTSREVAEQTITDLEARIVQLEEDIVSRDDEIARLTQELNDLENDRNQQIALLDTQLADLQQKYAALENTSNSTIATLQANITDLNNEVNALRIDIDRITNEAAEKEASLKEELARKEQQLADREDEIAEKNRLYALLEDKYNALDDEHSSAIERFSTEQFSFNKLQEKFIRGQKTMEDKIKALEAQIRDLQATLAQLQRDHEAALVEKEDEIRDLQVTSDQRTEVIAELHASVETLKESHAKIETDTRNTIDALHAAQRALQQQNEDMTAELLRRNAEAVEAAQSVKIKGLVVKAQNTDLKKVSNGKITKSSERVRIGKKGRKPLVKERKWRDSGFGADSDIENEEVEEAEREMIAG